MEGPPTCECLDMTKETSCLSEQSVNVQPLSNFIQTQTIKPESGFDNHLKDLIQGLKCENKGNKNLTEVNDKVLSGVNIMVGLLNEEQQLEEEISDLIFIHAHEPVAEYFS